MPRGAAELAVGRVLEADVLLLLDHRRDLAVLDCAQRLGRDLALLIPGARLLERGRPQQAADVIGAEWRLGARHGVSSLRFPTLCVMPRASGAYSTHGLSDFFCS